MVFVLTQLDTFITLNIQEVLAQWASFSAPSCPILSLKVYPPPSFTHEDFGSPRILRSMKGSDQRRSSHSRSHCSTETGWVLREHSGDVARQQFLATPNPTAKTLSPDGSAPASRCHDNPAGYACRSQRVTGGGAEKQPERECCHMCRCGWKRGVLGARTSMWFVVD